MSEESVNSRRCKGGNLFFSRILFCICLCGPVAYALAEESTVVSEIRQNEKKSISGVVTDTNDEPLIGATVCKHSASCVFFSPLFLPTFVASL